MTWLHDYHMTHTHIHHHTVLREQFFTREASVSVKSFPLHIYDWESDIIFYIILANIVSLICDLKNKNWSSPNPTHLKKKIGVGGVRKEEVKVQNDDVVAGIFWFGVEVCMHIGYWVLTKFSFQLLFCYSRRVNLKKKKIDLEMVKMFFWFRIKGNMKYDMFKYMSGVTNT